MLIRVSNTSPQKKSGENIEHDKEIDKKRYITPEQKKKESLGVYNKELNLRVQW